MARRERLFGLAEKLPKKHVETSGRRKVVMLESAARPGGADARQLPLVDIPPRVDNPQATRDRLSKPPTMLRRLYDWCIAAAGRPYATWLMGAISFRRKLVLSDPARHHADPDVAGAAGPRLVLRPRLHR